MHIESDIFHEIVEISHGYFRCLMNYEFAVTSQDFSDDDLAFLSDSREKLIQACEKLLNFPDLEQFLRTGSVGVDFEIYPEKFSVLRSRLNEILSMWRNTLNFYQNFPKWGWAFDQSGERIEN